MAEKYKDQSNTKKYWIMFIILIALLVFSALMAMILGIGDNNSIGYNTAIISIDGEITADQSSQLFGSQSAASTDIVNLLKNAQNDPNVKAVILEINSPGGSPVATDEISQAVKDLNNHNITTVSWIREEGASGAYWIATSSQHIIADRMSIVGSIGVYGSYIEWYGLMKDYNVTYQRLVSGEYKDTGVPYRPLSSAEEYMIQSKLDKLHEYFISSVAENRNMSVEDVRKLATGEIYLGTEAIDNGLIDELGGKQQAIDYLEKKLNSTITTKEFSKGKGLLDSLFSAMNQNSFYIGQGIASSMLKDTGFKITT
jgi:protease-4